MKSCPLSLLVLSLGVALAASGCVMPDQMSQIQKDLTDVRQQLREVRTDQDATVRKLEALESKPQQDENSIGRAEFADLSSQLDRVERCRACSWRSQRAVRWSANAPGNGMPGRSELRRNVEVRSRR